jgi:hypothetical protein
MKHFFTLYITIILLTALGILTFQSLYNQSGERSEILLRYNENYSITYPEALEAYRQLDAEYKTAKLMEYGPTDFGLPLHLFVISKNKTFSPKAIKEKGYRVLLINNGIHPGEPCGIDASVKLARDILEKRNSLWELLDSTVICIVPIYNIGGAYNRSPYSRANQNGPIDQGFRANAKNLDLNRDFAPMDSKNAQSFAEIFHQWKPQILIDTHTSNGADYQYVMTLIEPHPQGLTPTLADFYTNKMKPFLYSEMERANYPLTPYVDIVGETPESGIEHYISNPRYITGYGRAFNTLTFNTEAHMFKPFHERVLSTYEFFVATLKFMSCHGSEVAQRIDETNESIKTKKQYVLQWELDSSRIEYIDFLGYEAEYIPSKVTGSERLRYNRNKPYTKPVPHFKYHKEKVTITKPDYYIIPKAWHEVVQRLKINGVAMQQLEIDTILRVEAYYIEKYKTIERPYNGHYIHYDVEVRKEIQSIQLYSGDFLIPTNQSCNEYIIQMLEPQAMDSFFAWNFFDSILQRKEYFSPYIFEDYAEIMLSSNPQLKAEFEHKKQNDTQFASNAYAQLSFLYQRSPFFEKVFMRYPIFRYSPNANKI